MQRHPPLSRLVRANFKSRLKQAGMSLYDLIVTSAIASVLGVSAISMGDLVQDTRMTAAVNQMMGHLSLARSESIKRQATVVLCKSSDGATCTDDDGWQNGWIIFADNNNNDVADADETLIRVQQPLHTKLKLRYGETGRYRYLRYKPDGQAWPVATFSFCDTRGAAKAKAVIVYWTGRPRVSTKTSEGKPLRCT
ncbi:MAG: GspH/FimT family pseudopilin [Sulfuricaulis sp.]